MLRSFEQETGIRVRAHFDSEANKGELLFNRLLMEKKHPVCDVYWNNELARTIELKNAGVFAKYRSPQADQFSALFRDPDAMYHPIAARARVFIINTDAVPDPADYPRSMMDMLLPKWKGRFSIASPQFGTTGTHAAMLFTLWGEARARDFFQQVKANGAQIVAGNAQVRDSVKSGRTAWGLTDTDDAAGAVADGWSVAVVFPDQQPGAMGTMVVPNTVSILAGAPHPQAARRLYEYLLSAQVEETLAHGRGAHIPLRKGLEPPAAYKKSLPAGAGSLKALPVSFEDAANRMRSTREALKDVFR